MSYYRLLWVTKGYQEIPEVFLFDLLFLVGMSGKNMGGKIKGNCNIPRPGGFTAKTEIFMTATVAYRWVSNKGKVWGHLVRKLRKSYSLSREVGGE
jgi:hypothetical protein